MKHQILTLFLREILKEINISDIQLIIARWNARYFLKIVGGFFLDSARFACLIEKREKESEIFFYK